jgi:hypothetical protein
MKPHRFYGLRCVECGEIYNPMIAPTWCRGRPRDISKALRDEALYRVARAAGSWFDDALTIIANRLPSSWEGMGEDLKPHILPKIGPPHKPQVWGALVNAAVRLGFLEPTGRYDNMKTPSSHSRESKTYRRVPPLTFRVAAE